ncbi:hypothetical protein ROHU_003546 [Labeo rohita]|uniref:Uncharacterized protein n=1 Tax=Labeo rohita TaxID=84645 RepID=A0A498NWE4_LABRO|nr:hypothetical protein ROHU_034239 [Labeo rohita]RXN19598.1 hypothetical protein ROHU_025654 [Labeo rohita]RXN35767.1 hypothetical protein ROHU_003546 [Labeo rohita]
MGLKIPMVEQTNTTAVKMVLKSPMAEQKSTGADLEELEDKAKQGPCPCRLLDLRPFGVLAGLELTGVPAGTGPAI